MDGVIEAMVAHIGVQNIRRTKCIGLAKKLGLNSIEDIPLLKQDCLQSVPEKYKRAIIDLRNAHTDIYTTKWHPLHLLD